VKKRLGINSTIPYFFLAPFLLSFVVFFLMPAVYSFVLSFFQFRGYGIMRFLGLKNYFGLLTYSNFWISFYNTAFYFIVHTVPTMILSFVLAYMLQSRLLTGAQNVYKPVLFLPQVIPIIASSLIWIVILSKETGVINQILGTRIDFLENATLRKWAVVMLLIWRDTGWYMIIYLAGLTTVSDEICDASRIDGTNAAQHIFRIVLPIMRPIFLFAFIINSITSLKIYTEPAVLLTINGSPLVSPNAMALMHLLIANVRGANFGMASALGWIVFIVAMALTFLWMRLLGEKDN
jgi:ABC-type sugar transport system permease subunit